MKLVLPKILPESLFKLWIPNKHCSGMFGLIMLVLPMILPESLHEVWIPNKHFSGIFGHEASVIKDFTRISP